MNEPTHTRSAADAAARVLVGDLSAEALAGDCLDRIAEREGRVRAWVHLDPAAALAQARARDIELAQALDERAAPAGTPLHGVPVGIKDLIDTGDMPTRYGSPIYEGHQPQADAACVGRLRGVGAVILGKTVTTEFALFHPGPTRNPHDLGRTPGGSSSGSAAAVADGHVPLALGTQTAGSVIRPASFCGIWGLKPTFGRIPVHGVKPISPSLDTVGMFARAPDDLALALGVLDPNGSFGGSADRLAVGKDLRVGFARTWEWEQAEPSTQATIEDLAERLGLVAVDLPEEFAELVDAQETIMAVEATHSLARERVEHRGSLSASLLDLLADGDRRAEGYADALTLAERCRALLPEVFADVDALVSPAVLGEAPEGLGATGDPLFCRAWTLLGTPAVAVPGLRGPHGLPLGVQVIADRERDDVALAGARWLADRLGGEERAR